MGPKKAKLGRTGTEHGNVRYTAEEMESGRYELKIIINYLIN